MNPKIFYVCADCHEYGNYDDPVCYDREDLRVMPDGEWICVSCYCDGDPEEDHDIKPIYYEDEKDYGLPRWETLPIPPEYMPKEPSE